MVIIKDRDKIVNELAKHLDKGSLRLIQYTKQFKHMIRETVLFVTSDNLQFVKNIKLNKISSNMVFAKEEDELEVSLEGLKRYTLEYRNPHLIIHDRYYLKKVINERNDNLTYFELTTEPTDSYRELTKEEVEEVNEVVKHAQEVLNKRVEDYWEKWSYLVCTFVDHHKNL